MTYEPKRPPRDDFAERVIAKQNANRVWPAPKPSASDTTEHQKPPKRLARISKKTREKRLANGESGLLFSSIAAASKKSVIRKRSKKRVADDARIYGPVEFREHLHRSACLGCGYRGLAIQQAHMTTGGVGRKSSWDKTGPLCGPHEVRYFPEQYVVTVGCHVRYDESKKSAFADLVRSNQKAFIAEWLERGE